MSSISFSLLRLFDSTSYVLLIIILFLVFILSCLRQRNSSHYPPGPWRLPIIGNLHQIILCNMSVVQFMEKYKQSYGDVFTMRVGGINRVVISGYQNMKYLLEKKADYTSNRSIDSLAEGSLEVTKDYPGLFWSPYPHWKTLRFFAFQLLRKEGMGKPTLEPALIQEIESYIEYFISPHIGKPVDLSKSMMQATANMMMALVRKSRFDYNDPVVMDWNKNLAAIVDTNLKASFTRNIPFAQYLPGDLTGRLTEKALSMTVLPFFHEMVHERKQELDIANPTNYIDRFLIHSMKEEAKGTKHHCFDDANAAITTLHLYIAGAETTATVTRWGLYYLCKHPEVQQKLHKEITAIIGQRPVQYKDKYDLPYTQAVLLEIVRMSNVLPTALPHTLEKDLVVDGKVIPAGADLIMNMASVLFDEQVFEEPYTFKPQRYLEGDIYTKKIRTMAFGIGRRNCPGRDLAKMFLFFTFTTLMQRYEVESAETIPPVTKGICSIVNSPPNIRMIFTER